MLPGVLIPEFTDDEVLAPSRRSGLMAAIAPKAGVSAHWDTSAGGTVQRWVLNPRHYCSITRAHLND
jgi:hypothetical protein